VSLNSRKKDNKRVKLKQIKVRIPEKTDAMIRKLASKYGFSIAFVIRFILENRVNNYLNTMTSVDYEQSDKIEELLRETSTELRLIRNNIKRIGVNYNQEIKLKNAENKYNSIIKNETSSIFERHAAQIELEGIKRELADTKPEINKLENELEHFEKLVIRMEDALCHIQE